ncbi:hypothetical protein AX769_16870 [Frondihabitans sp. PAMC 28766]|uniref:ABC transporter permease n=1 Tax=Frondihabitans sp. PAMC 28766 TaxID=1795630 RepID=UPI00078EE23C|nr:ABC transporter permease [Frondihabitans sp. PAMC 28766]AMM21505.1 hypothetical protein AX769_16870 [Frondihabitans sp. PAMC 28766]
MFFTYLRREIGNRKKQTLIIALGMALAITLVVIVNGFAAGVKTAQTTALSSVYGVGTDITVTKTVAAGTGGGQRFAFGSGGGSTSTSGGTSKTNLSKNNLSATMGTATYASSELATVQKVSGVKAATATLNLTDSSFSGSVQSAPSSGSGPSSSSGTSTSQGAGSAPTGSGSTSSGSSTSTGQGPSSFSVDSFTVTGISTASTTVGPMSATTLTSGRYLTSADDGKDVVVLDSTYAKTNSLTLGKTVTIGSTKFTVVGLVKSTSSSSSTAADSYIPLDTAQTVSGLTGKISTIDVTATSSNDVADVKSGIEKVFSGATVSTEADLASTISGSLSTVSNLVSKLGTWLSLLVLVAAFAIAILFTISGVSRRTREFGTLKAIGWSNGRIVRQVAGESLVNGLIGGVIGAVVGVVGILVINVIAPTLSAGTATASRSTGGPGGAGGTGGPGGALSSAASTASSIALHIPLTAGIILLAVGLAILGGLIAGAFGGWRASRLRPAAALRSVA